MVTPCFDCGDDLKELEHLASGKHTYSEYLAFGVPIVLWNFCQADFSSYDPKYFNRPRGTKLGLPEFTFVRQRREPAQAKDKFCPSCERRLAFLRFLRAVRATGKTPTARGGILDPPRLKSGR